MPEETAIKPKITRRNEYTETYDVDGKSMVHFIKEAKGTDTIVIAGLDYTRNKLSQTLGLYFFQRDSLDALIQRSNRGEIKVIPGYEDPSSSNLRKILKTVDKTLMDAILEKLSSEARSLLEAGLGE